VQVRWLLREKVLWLWVVELMVKALTLCHSSPFRQLSSTCNNARPNADIKRQLSTYYVDATISTFSARLHQVGHKVMHSAALTAHV
jgi:hypothetical protein